MPADLYGSLFRRSLFPLLDRANGTTITAKLEALHQAERLDRAVIRARQEEKLERVIEHARRSSKLYPRLWSERERPGVGSDHALLDGLPVVTKEDLAASAEFPLSSFRGRILTTFTSGSTGRPMAFHRSAEQESWFWAQRFRIWGWAGYRPGDRYLTINLNPRTKLKKRLQDLFLRCTYLSFNADDQNSRLILDCLRERSIHHLNGFASSLYVLARYQLDHGLPRPELYGITSTGDGLFEPYRETIERAFGVRVLDYYGAGGEGLHLASQCPDSGSRYHLLPEDAIFEVLGPEGPASPGEVGRVVATQLENQAMPLVRYELGDLAVAAPADARCSCGRTLPMLERIEGRIPDLVVLRDGTFLVMHFFVVLFKNLQSVRHYQVVQESIESIRVRLVPQSDCDRGAVETAIRREIEAATRGLLAVELEWTGEIPLSGRGKRRLVISRVGRDRLGHPAGVS